MKKFLMLMGITFLVACDSNKDEKAASLPENPITVQEKVTYPVASVYAPTWEIGDPQNAVTVLNLYNAWDNGNIDAFTPALADSVELHFSNGDIMTGKSENVIQQIRDFRKIYTAIKSNVYSFTSLRHPDTKENWVAVWVKEVYTTTKGISDSTELHESWRINNNGKVDLCFQYSRSIKKPK